MTTPARVFVLLAATVCASAQVTLSTVQGGVATAAGAAHDYGAVPLGTVADAAFRLTNTGSQTIYLTSLSVQGPGFSVACPLSPDLCGAAALQELPILIGPGGILNFTVQFAPSQDAKSSSANMTIAAGNTITIILSGKIVPGLALLLTNQPLAAGQTLTFGSVPIGSSQTLALMLANPAGNPPVNVPAIPAPSNSDFSLAGPALSATILAPGTSLELDVIFAPGATGPRQGTLIVGALRYPLQGTGLAAPPTVFPDPSIQVNLAAAASARQGTIAVSLASAATASGTGALTLSFQPLSGVGGDPTVAFADGTRSVAFTVAKGASTGQFAGAPTVAFGTGTTAGALTFTVALGSSAAQATVSIPAVVAAIDAAVAARNVDCDVTLLYCTATNVELEINGWDNTRSVSQMVFTFFNAAGSPIAPGNITVAAATAFQEYFSGSNLGGVFGVHALFPVNGDTLQVVSAQVRIVNSAGTAQSAKIVF